MPYPGGVRVAGGQVQPRAGWGPAPLLLPPLPSSPQGQTGPSSCFPPPPAARAWAGLGLGPIPASLSLSMRRIRRRADPKSSGIQPHETARPPSLPSAGRAQAPRRGVSLPGREACPQPPSVPAPSTAPQHPNPPASPGCSGSTFIPPPPPLQRRGSTWGTAGRCWDPHPTEPR